MTGDGWGPVLDRLTCLRGRRVEVRALAGGLSSRTLRVTTVDTGPVLDLVVRPPGSGLLATDRAAEHRAAAAAAETGAGPPVVEFVPPDGPLAVQHLEARALRPEEVRSDLARVAALCRRFHAGPALTVDVDMAAVRRRYEHLVARHGAPVPRGHGPLAPTVDRVLGVLTADPVPRVPCHNDLPGGNVLDDGSRLWLVDFEHAATNEPWCELGTLASGAGLSPDETAALVSAYDDRVGPGALARTRLWDAVCSWTWVLWAALQEVGSDVEADYRALADALLERAQEGLADTSVDLLLPQLRSR